MQNIIKLLAIFALLVGLIAKPSIAQTQQNSISVSPSIAHIDLATDSPQYELTYQNNTDYDVNLTLSVQDFTELEEGYKLSFLQENDAKNYKYSLSSWISFENPFLQLAPKEKKSVKVFIDKERITKGGHYASILAQIATPEQNKNINVKAVLSSLLFVRASTGKEVEEGKINSFSPLQNWIEFPDYFTLSFENSGNVFVTPYGLVQVFDPFGKLVAKGIINSESLDVLPESIRRFEIKTPPNQKFLIPGFYSANVLMHFGKTNTKLSQKITFFSYGSLDPLKLFISLAIIAILMIYLKKRKK